MDIFPGLRVDKFTKGAAVYLLSHYHADHMQGLRAGWKRAAIHATELTCLLLEHVRGIEREYLRPVAVWQTFEAGGFTVTVLPANHCPGAVMFHVVGKKGKGGAGRRSALYTGDFRLNDEIRESLADTDPVDTLYVDSTYADPRYRFPPQEEALQRVVDIALGAAPDMEIMLGVYTVGKNRVVEAVSRALGEPFYMTERVRRVHEILGLGDCVTDDRNATRLRGYARGYFEEYFFRLPRARREKTVVIIPTGWAVDLLNGEPEGPVLRGGAEFHYVPYSEHCDSAEREEAIRLVGAKRVVEC